jgi:hypothetical protein
MIHRSQNLPWYVAFPAWSISFPSSSSVKEKRVLVKLALLFVHLTNYRCLTKKIKNYSEFIHGRMVKEFSHGTYERQNAEK